MTDVKSMTDGELHISAVKTAEKQRQITLDLLKHLNEIEHRHLYSKCNSSSLHAYCVKELKMTNGEAGRHIGSARLLIDVPVIEEKILKGSVSLTSISQASVFLKKETNALGKRFSNEEKQALILDLEDKSTREVDLSSRSSNPEVHFKDRVTPKSNAVTEVKLYLDEEAMKNLERLKEVLSHSDPHASYSGIVKRALKEAVEKHDPLKKAERSKTREEKRNSTPAPEAQCVKVFEKVRVKRQVWMRDQGRCTFADPRTKERCNSRHFIEEDHIIPKAMGGAYSAENIRLRCRAHNQRHAINTYGWQKMSVHLKR